MSSYVPLWCETNFSFLEGASHPEELVEHAQAVGLDTLAITDRDGLQGIVRAHVAGKEHDGPSAMRPWTAAAPRTWRTGGFERRRCRKMAVTT